MITILDGSVDISALEYYSGAKYGLIRPLPLKLVKGHSRNQQILFMNKYALYCIPTFELIDYLRGLIAGKKAIEIGCGVGIIGRSLGIPITDSRLQERPEIIAYLQLLRQPTIKYPPDVEELDALSAVDKYNPDVVLGSFITHLWEPGMDHGSMFGVDTIKLIKKVPEYYMIGNLNVHQHDPAMKYLDGYEHHDFLITRGEVGKSVIFKWKNND